MKRMYWRKQKTLAMLANRRQYNMEFVPAFTTVVEIYTGDDYFIATEASTPSNEIIIIAES